MEQLGATQIWAREAVTPRGRLVYAAAVSAGQGHRGAPGRGGSRERVTGAACTSGSARRRRAPSREPFGPLHPRGYAGRFSVSELRYRPIRVLRELNLQQQLE